MLSRPMVIQLAAPYSRLLDSECQLLAWARRNLQHVSVSLHAFVQPSSCAIPSLMLTSDILSPSILYGRFRGFPASVVWRSTKAPSWRTSSRKATMALSNLRCMKVRPRGMSPDENSSKTCLFGAGGGALRWLPPSRLDVGDGWS